MGGIGSPILYQFGRSHSGSLPTWEKSKGREYRYSPSRNPTPGLGAGRPAPGSCTSQKRNNRNGQGPPASSASSARKKTADIVGGARGVSYATPERSRRHNRSMSCAGPEPALDFIYPREPVRADAGTQGHREFWENTRLIEGRPGAAVRPTLRRLSPDASCRTERLTRTPAAVSISRHYPDV